MLRKGFSVIEVSVANILMSILVIGTSSVVVALGRPLLTQTARIELHEQAQLATSALRRDLGGHLSRCVNGSKGMGIEVGRQVINGSELRLCFDGGSADGVAQWDKPDNVVRYYLSGDDLIRYDEQETHAATIARHVLQFQVADDGGDTTILIRFRAHRAEKVIHFVSQPAM